MELTSFFSFVAATALMIALPGPSVLLTVAHSLAFGWKRALLTVAGATAGIAVQLSIAAIGIGALVSFASVAFRPICLAGAGYLVFLGVKTWIDSSRMAVSGGAPASGGRLFIQGLAITLPNPKSLIFIVAFLPQFIDPGRSIPLQFSIIVPAFLFITFSITSMWALLSGAAAAGVKEKSNLAIVFRVAAALIVASGIGMVFTHLGG